MATAPAHFPLPLRVPELAPSLGRIIVPRRLQPLWVPLDDIREELATRVLELGGDGRAAAARDERERVLEDVASVTPCLHVLVNNLGWYAIERLPN
ncbi:MAG: hypothetical protein ACREU4_13945, partial [Burkholderiales bacterium]